MEKEMWGIIGGRSLFVIECIGWISIPWFGDEMSWLRRLSCCFECWNLKIVGTCKYSIYIIFYSYLKNKVIWKSLKLNVLI